MAVAAIFAVTACSHSEEIPECVDTNEIEFEVSATRFGGETRDADITTTENIPEFRIWGYDYGLYSYLMKGIIVTRTGLNSWSYSPAVDWTGNMMCFTAVSPAAIDINTNPWWLDMIQYKNEGHEDLLVCRVTNVKQTTGRLKLHFYHALSLVNVKLHTALPANTVNVKSVTIVNVSDIGQFRYPAEGFYPTTTLQEVSDCWDIYGQSNRIPIFLSDSGTYLSDIPLDADNQGYEFFIPSRLGDFDFDAYFNSSYLEVDYKIEDGNGSTVWPDATTDYRLISKDNPGYGQLRIGLGEKLPDKRWQSGMHYRYSLDLSEPAQVPPGAASDDTRSNMSNDMSVFVTIL